jgi:hypothetical protein
MKSIYKGYQPYQYAINGTSQIAKDFYALEKAAKISWRIIDLIEIVTNAASASFQLLSSQIKDVVLTIESTRFFCVSFPLFFSDSSGKTFFETRTYIQIVERISITFHLALKTLFGADKAHLINLGIIGSYTLGNLTVLKWTLESTILMYNFFGAIGGAIDLYHTTNKLHNIQGRINKYLQLNQFLPTGKQNKWDKVKQKSEFEQTKAWLKIAATVSKFILITFATSIAAINFWNIQCQIIILTLGIVSDGLGMTSFYHQKYLS